MKEPQKTQVVGASIARPLIVWVKSATFPSRGRQRAKSFSLPADFFFEQFSDTHSAPSFCAYSLPLEGKVSAEPTDEVFIKSSTAYATTERILNDNLHCHRSGCRKNDTHYSNPNRHSGEERTSNARPYNLNYLQLFHLENGNMPNIAAGYNRAIAKAAIAIFNADCSPARRRSGYCNKDTLHS